jgi:hypothetical protein
MEEELAYREISQATKIDSVRAQRSDRTEVRATRDVKLK